jgi:hypothetical protein
MRSMLIDAAMLAGAIIPGRAECSLDWSRTLYEIFGGYLLSEKIPFHW